MAPAAIAIEEIYNSHIYPDTNVVSVENGGEQTIYGAFASKDIIRDAMMKKIAKIDVDTCQPGEEDAFFVADMGVIYRQHIRWKTNLGGVKPFYGELMCHSFDSGYR
jgi:ornithine decarboxylase